MTDPLPAISLVAVPGRRRQTLDIARDIERRGFSGIYMPSRRRQHAGPRPEFGQWQSADCARQILANFAGLSRPFAFDQGQDGNSRRQFI